jgi:hypothetical protein
MLTNQDVIDLMQEAKTRLRLVLPELGWDASQHVNTAVAAITDAQDAFEKAAA